MKRGPHPYRLPCQCSSVSVLHEPGSRGGESGLICRGCGTFRLPQRKKKRFKINPSSRVSHAVKDAARLYEAFTGHDGDEVARVDLPPPPKVALAIGRVLLVGYETIRDGVRENYVHRFAKHARPLLAASHDGRSVFLLGGAYTFTDRGIVDKKR